MVNLSVHYNFDLLEYLRIKSQKDQTDVCVAFFMPGSISVIE